MYVCMCACAQINFIPFRAYRKCSCDCRFSMFRFFYHFFFIFIQVIYLPTCVCVLRPSTLFPLSCLLDLLKKTDAQSEVGIEV